MLFNQTIVNTDLQTETYTQANKTDRKFINLNILFIKRITVVQNNFRTFPGQSPEIREFQDKFQDRNKF